MKTQTILLLIILGAGGSVLGGEYLWVKEYPRYHDRVVEKTLNPLPYHSEAMGIDMQVAAGLYGGVQDFPGGIRIFRPKLLGGGPTLTVTAKPNPDHTPEFSPQALAQWETQGVSHNILSYQFDHTKINDRDAVLTWQYDNEHRWLVVTARVITPDRVIRGVCTTGGEDIQLYRQACESSLRSLKIADPPSLFDHSAAGAG